MRLSLTFLVIGANNLFKNDAGFILLKKFVPEWIVDFLVIPPGAFFFLSKFGVGVVLGWKFSVKESVDTIPEDAIVRVVTV